MIEFELVSIGWASSGLAWSCGLSCRNYVAIHCAFVARFPSMHLVRALVFIPSLFGLCCFVVRIWLSELSTTLLQVVVARIPKWSDLRLQRCLAAGVSSGELRVLTPHEFEETYLYFFIFLKVFRFSVFSDDVRSLDGPWLFFRPHHRFFLRWS